MNVKIALAVMRTRQRHVEQANALLDETLHTMLSRMNEGHLKSLELKCRLSVYRQQLQRYDAGAPLLLETFHGRETKLGSEDPHTIDSLREVVSLYEAWAKPDETETWRAKLSRPTDAEEQD